MYQILLVPNITWQKDINQDSYVKVISDIIGELNKIRDDLFWHSPISARSDLLNYPNVKQYVIEIPSYPNSMRGHFDYVTWLKIVDWKKKDFDLVYSHLPEWTLNVSNLISNVTNIGDIPIIGYTHWSEIKEITAYPKTYLLNNINGLLEMYKCGVNTDAQKRLIIDNVKDVYSKIILDRLDEILEPHYLGVPAESVREKICETPSKTIVFNHRPQVYKNFPYFLELMDKLWSQRQDFKVWVPLLDKSDKPYVDTKTYPLKHHYYRHLSRCSVCYCPKQLYAGWSVSGTDALMNGVPVLFYDTDYYHELRGNDGDYHTTDDEALNFFNQMFDNVELRNSKAKNALSFSKNVLVWENRIKLINKRINEALASTKETSGKSVKRDEIVKYIRDKKSVSKADLLKYLGWGVGIRFSHYRKYILNQPDIDTKMLNGIEHYTLAGYEEKEFELFDV